MTTTVPITLTVREKLERRDGFLVAGFGGTFGIDNRSDIPKMWQRFAPRLGFKGQKGSVTYGICISGEPAMSNFRYMATVEVEPDAELPADFETFEMPAQTYLVYRQVIGEGNLHPQVIAAVQQIWSKLVPASGWTASGGPDFEYYPEDFEEKPGKWVEYWIPVKA